MATKHFAIRIIAETSDDTTDTPVIWVDKTFTLDGYTAKETKDLVLGPTAADQILTIPDACGIVILSEDYPFSVRLASAQKLVGPVLFWSSIASDTDDKIIDVSVLLTGNGTNAAALKILVLDQT
ncbi:MAG: hypothetical protein WC911_01845 [Thermoleophilia bacterium]